MSHGLSAVDAARVVDWSGCESIDDLGLLGKGELRDLVRQAGLKPVPAAKLRRALTATTSSPHRSKNRMHQVPLKLSMLGCLVALAFLPVMVLERNSIPVGRWEETVSVGQQHQSIPRQIFQSFKVPFNDLLPGMRNASLSWRDLNPEYEYRYFDDEEQLAYVLRYGDPAFVRAYNASLSGAGRCDLWRALVVYHEGGVYADIDTTLLAPLRTIIQPNDDAISGIGALGDLHQWFLAYAPKHPILGRLIDHAVQVDPRAPQLMEDIAGPHALHEVAKAFFGNGRSDTFRFKPGTYWVKDTVAGGKDDGHYNLRVISGDHLGGNIQFKYNEYLDEIKAQNVTYWMSAAPSKEKPNSNKDNAPAIVYLANEGQIRRGGRLSCPTLYHSLESLRRHLPSKWLAPPTVYILHDKPFGKRSRMKVQEASPFPVQFVMINFIRPNWEERHMPAELSDYDQRYRRMCAFWFHTIFELDALPEYVMRMDTDTCLTSDVATDPFVYMQENGVDYMFHSTFEEPPSVIEGLRNFTMRNQGRPRTDHKNDPMIIWQKEGMMTTFFMDVFSTNLEWMHMPAFRRPEILEWKERVKEDGGIYRHRWGDAPLRTVVVTKFFNRSSVVRFCNFSYNHSSWDPFAPCDIEGNRLNALYGWKVQY